jgi:hypothetical protein
MAGARAGRAMRSIIGAGLGLGVVLLAGCTHYYEGGSFTTNQQVALRLYDSEDAPITAILPPGTPVQGTGWVSAQTWRVTSAYGTGFVPTRFLTLHLADSPLYEEAPIAEGPGPEGPREGARH